LRTAEWARSFEPLSVDTDDWVILFRAVIARLERIAALPPDGMRHSPRFVTSEGVPVNHSMLIPALFSALSLVACDRPTVVNVPATPAAAPGPAGPHGATGNQGTTGSMGATGKTGNSTTLIVVPPAASAPAN
jgi:hypothetical protein